MGESLAGALAEVARRLAAGGDVAGGMQVLVDRLVAHVPGADAWAFLGAGPAQRLLVASPGVRVDLPPGPGPCTEAVVRGCEVAGASADDLRSRWGPVGEALVAGGYEGVHVVPLGVDESCVGTVMVGLRRPGPLASDELDALRAFAALAAVGLSLQRTEEEAAQLQHALDSRVTVEQAKGIVAATMGIPVGGALEVMRRYARDRNRKLADVAADVVSGDLPVESLGAAQA